MCYFNLTENCKRDFLFTHFLFDKKHYRSGRVLLLGVFMVSRICFAQDCDKLSLDDITDPGIYNVATLVESDGLRNGPDYAEATIYYPTDATPPFASIAIVPGYVSPQSSIQDWGPFLASHGIVVMTIGTNSIFENPYDRRDALLDAIITLKAEDIRTDSPLLGKIDTDKIAVGGWSMGGGGAQLAAVSDPTLKAVMALCPWLDNQATSDDLDHQVPVLIFSAELDIIAPPAGNADIHYDFTPETTDKLLFEINNAGHSVANDPTGGQDYVGKIALSWLNHFLVGDSCYCPLFLDAPSVASTYSTNVICPTIPTSVKDLFADNEESFQLYPSPCRDSINLEIEIPSSETKYEVFSIAGSMVLSGSIVGQITHIETHKIPSGFYFLNVVTPYSSKKMKFIVL